MSVRLVAIALALVPATLSAMPLDPSADGRFPVGVTTVTLTDAVRQRSLVTEVWYRRAPPAATCLPAAGAIRSCSSRTGSAASGRTTST